MRSSWVRVCMNILLPRQREKSLTLWFGSTLVWSCMRELKREKGPSFNTYSESFTPFGWLLKVFLWMSFVYLFVSLGLWHSLHTHTHAASLSVSMSPCVCTRTTERSIRRTFAFIHVCSYIAKLYACVKKESEKTQWKNSWKQTRARASCDSEQFSWWHLQHACAFRWYMLCAA